MRSRPRQRDPRITVPGEFVNTRRTGLQLGKLEISGASAALGLQKPIICMQIRCTRVSAGAARGGAVFFSNRRELILIFKSMRTNALKHCVRFIEASRETLPAEWWRERIDESLERVGEWNTNVTNEFPPRQGKAKVTLPVVSSAIAGNAAIDFRVSSCAEVLAAKL